MALQIKLGTEFHFVKTKNKPETTGWLKNGLACQLACSIRCPLKKKKKFLPHILI